MPEIPTSPDKQQITSTITTTSEGPSTDEVDIMEISSDDSSDCILLEQAPGPYHEPDVQNKDDPPEATKPYEDPKVKRVRFTTPEPSPPSEQTSPAPPPPTPSSSISADKGNLLTRR